MINPIRLVSLSLLMAGILLIVTCSGQNDSKGTKDNILEDSMQIASSQPLISFDLLNHDFGTIIEGEQVVCYFDYKNSGQTDLVISLVEATCGCTTPNWSSEPLKPGEVEQLKVIFDTTGRKGSQRKVVTVKSNASNSVVRLTLIAEVNSNV